MFSGQAIYHKTHKMRQCQAVKLRGKISTPHGIQLLTGLGAKWKCERASSLLHKPLNKAEACTHIHIFFIKSSIHNRAGQNQSKRLRNCISFMSIKPELSDRAKVHHTSAFKASMAGVAAAASPVFSMYSCCTYKQKSTGKRNSNMHTPFKQIDYCIIQLLD